jgi:Tfp pilus assembly protein PilO
MNIKSKIKTENSLGINITISLLIVLLLTTLFFSIKTILDIRNLNRLIYEKRFELETKYQQGLSLKKTRLELDQSRERLNNISKIILKTENTLDFINDIEKTADAYNVTQTIKLTEFNKPLIPTPQPIQINFTGSYSNTLSFLQALDVKPYYLTIDKISFSKQGTEVSALIDGNIYWE